MSGGDSIDRQLRSLSSYGLDDDCARLILETATFLACGGGPDLQTYWQCDYSEPIADLVGLRDEMMIVVAGYAATTFALIKSNQYRLWATQFAAAYGFLARSMTQTAMSIDTLTMARCYLDAFAICRGLIGRVNLVTLFSLNPWLFDDWLAHSDQERFRDGQVRDVLAPRKVEVFGRLYAEFSESVHSHALASVESGSLEPGLFPEVPSAAQRIYVAAKLLLGAAAAVGVAVASQDAATGALPSALQRVGRALEQTDWMLAPNRFEHLTLTISPDRHWEPIGKNKFAVLTGFDASHLRGQLAKFHPARGQRTTLRAPYAFSEADAEKLRAELRAANRDSDD